MGIILSGPVNLETVTNLLTSVSRAFFQKQGLDATYIETEFWKPEVITNPDLKYFPEEIVNSYRQLIQSRKVEYLTREPKEFATSTWFWMRDGGRDKCWMAKTDVINLTSIEDLFSGQIIPPVVKKFLISTEPLRYRFNYNPESTWNLFEKFVEYRNQMIEQAQERIDQSVSKAAYNIMKDLHS
ncbi:MAG: hypothetical protein WC511_05895 [Candidatus Pacearchaeota archaeon]